MNILSTEVFPQNMNIHNSYYYTKKRL